MSKAIQLFQKADPAYIKNDLQPGGTEKKRPTFLNLVKIFPAREATFE